MTNGVDRDLGAFEARLDSYETQLTELRADVKQLLAYAAGTKGGWRMLAAVGAIGGTVGAGVLKLLTMVKAGG